MKSCRNCKFSNKTDCDIMLYCRHKKIRVSPEDLCIEHKRKKGKKGK